MRLDEWHCGEKTQTVKEKSTERVVQPSMMWRMLLLWWWEATKIPLSLTRDHMDTPRDPEILLHMVLRITEGRLLMKVDIGSEPTAVELENLTIT